MNGGVTMQKQHQKVIEALEEQDIPIFVNRILFNEDERAQYDDGTSLYFYSETCLFIKEWHDLFPQNNIQWQTLKYYTLPPKALFITDFAVVTDKNKDVEPKLEDKIFHCGLNGYLSVDLLENGHVVSSVELNGNQLPFFDDMKKVIIDRAKKHKVFTDSIEGLEQVIGVKEIEINIKKDASAISDEER